MKLEFADQAAKSAALNPVVDVRIAFHEDVRAQLRKLHFVDWARFVVFRGRKQDQGNYRGYKAVGSFLQV